jgi:tRNA A37 methylthiotransferase MiaB
MSELERQCKEAAVTPTFIAGFPGETEEEFDHP